MSVTLSSRNDTDGEKVGDAFVDIETAAATDAASDNNQRFWWKWYQGQ